MVEHIRHTPIPVLQGVARCVLAQVASAHAAERNWSIYGQIKNDRRVGLGHARADGRVYCHEALQLHEKLYDVQDEYVEFSDSDSNASSVDENVDDELAKLMR